MRIDTLRLLAYGPFTGVEIDLAAGSQGLHVIHGRNEAGKSSALRALSAALFGIRTQTTDAFVHEYSALRIGLVLRDSRGKELSFVRRKANKDALRAADDVAKFDENALRRVLGSVDAEEFHRVFGLDHLRLREGGSQLLAAADSVGSAIVGASLGVPALRAIRQAIDSEAADLFVPRGRKRLNTSIADWNTLQQEVRAAALTVARWTDERKRMEQLAGTRDALAKSERESKARLAELELVRRVRVRIDSLLTQRKELAAFDSIPDLPPEFDERRRQLQEDTFKVSTQLDGQRADLETKKERLDTLPGESTLIHHEKDVLALTEKEIEVKKAQRDAPNIRRQRDEVAAARDALLLDLGLPRPLDAAGRDRLNLALAARDACTTLVTRHAAIVTKLRDHDVRVAELESLIAAKAMELTVIGEPVDPCELTDALAEASLHSQLDLRLEQTIAKLATLDRDVEIDLRALSGFGGTADDLERAAIPGPAVWDAFTNRFSALDAEDRDTRARQEQLAARANELANRRARFELGGAAPSESELMHARERRDVLWALVREAWLAGANVDSRAASIDPTLPLPDAHAAASRRADEIADRLRAESDRAATATSLELDRKELERDHRALDATSEDRRVRRDALTTEWNDLWRAIGFVAGSLSAMRDVASRREKLVERLTERRALEKDRSDLTTHRTRLVTNLLRGLENAAHPAPRDSDSRPLAELVTRATEAHARLVSSATTRSDLVKEKRRLEVDLAKELKRRGAIEQEFVEWKAAFRDTTRDFPHREGDAPDASLRSLDRIASILARDKEVADFETRLGSIDRDAAELERASREFRDGVLPNAPFENASAFVKELQTLFSQQSRESLERTRVEREFAAAKAKVDEAERSLAAMTLALQSLAKEAGVKNLEELPAIARDAARKRELRAKISELEAGLAGEGIALDQLERKVAEHAGIDIESHIEAIELELSSLSPRVVAARDAATTARNEFEALTLGAGAVDHAEQMASVAARIRDEAEHYTRLVLASSLLGVAVERFRRQNEDPLLGAASRYFFALTRGRYDRVETDVDDDGVPFFVVHAVAPEAMRQLDELSDGTRDQLHLALVLASLERRFDGGAEPMPLVLDDVLVHFDDERSLATLETLATFSKRAQVILFTHHDRIREQASSLAGNHEVFTHELSRGS
jgi:uncharacterized protein YhaN